MNSILKNILAVIVGLLIGGIVNGLLIMNSAYIISPPADADLTTMAGLIKAMPLMEPKHFLVPFLAHALGTIVGAFITVKIAANYKLPLALLIGLLFFIGGIYTVFVLPAPLWFDVVDLVGAYIPMAWIGAKLARAKPTQQRRRRSSRTRVDA